MHFFSLTLTPLVLFTYVSGYIIHELRRNKPKEPTVSIISYPTTLPSPLPGKPDNDRNSNIQQYVLDGERRVGESCYRITDEYEVTLNFDEIQTNNKMIFPDGYGNLEWSCRFRIFNETEQEFPPQNHATSHPNLAYASNEALVDSYCEDDGQDPWIAIKNDDRNGPIRVFDVISLRHQPLYGLKAPVVVAFKQEYVPGASQKSGIRYYAHVYNPTLRYPYKIDLDFQHMTKLQMFVIPSGDVNDVARSPFFLDDIKIRIKELTPISGCDMENIPRNGGNAEL